MVDVARFFLEFVQEETCGKCVPCRVGTKRMLEILNRICAGQGEEADVERLIELGEMIKDTSLCGLGQTAPNPVLSTIRHFGHEYAKHIRDKHCRGGRLRRPGQGPLLQRLPGQRRHSRLRLPGRREALRRGPAAAPRAQPVGRDLLAGLLPHLREQVPARRPGRARSPSAASSASWSSRRLTIQLPEVSRATANAERKIAIVGAGPAGLSCAYFLARLGYRPKVFEAEPRPGGMLVQAIPAYRLPREISPARSDDRAAWAWTSSTTWRWAATSRSGPAGRGLRGRVPRRRRPAGRRPRHARRGRRGHHRRPLRSSGPTTSAARCRWASTWWSSAAATRPSTPPAPPCASAPRRSPSSTAAAASADAGLRRGDRRGRARRHRPAAADRAGGDHADADGKLRRRASACRCGWASSTRSAAAGRRTGATPLHGRATRSSWPSARRSTASRSSTACSVETSRKGWLCRPTRTRPDLGEMDLRRRRRRHRPVLGGRGRRRRRAGGRGHRPVPDRRQPRLLARDVEVDTAFDPDAEPVRDARAPSVPVVAASGASATSTKSSCPGRPRWPSPRRGAACAATTEKCARAETEVNR